MWNDTVIDVVRRAKGPTLDLSSLKLSDFSLATLEDRQHSVRQILNAFKYMEPAQRNRLAGELAGAANVELSRGLMLTTEQVRTLNESGMTIGAHTVSHPILARVGEREALGEMIESKLRIEAIIGHNVELFAYPNGKPDTDYNATHVQLARNAGFSAAVSTGWGTATRRSDMFQIPRFTPWDRTALRYALRLARNMRHVVTVAG
jgi:peptidoglycan/xylan/chitin deacetylase (PgdA/CDA1 family)